MKWLFKELRNTVIGMEFLGKERYYGLSFACTTIEIHNRQSMRDIRKVPEVQGGLLEILSI